MIDLKNIVALDVPTHVEVRCRQPHDDFGPEFDEAFAKFFKTSHRLTIQEPCDYYRTLKNGIITGTNPMSLSAAEV